MNIEIYIFLIYLLIGIIGGAIYVFLNAIAKRCGFIFKIIYDVILGFLAGFACFLANFALNYGQIAVSGLLAFAVGCFVSKLVFSLLLSQILSFIKKKPTN